MPSDLEFKNNGHSNEKPPVFDLGDFENNFISPNVTNAISKLVDPGDTPKDLSMRAHFWDFDYKTAWVKLYRKAVHFGDDELKELLLMGAAGDTSINGYRTELLVKSIIGSAYGPEKDNSNMGKLKKFLKIGDDKPNG